MDKMKVFVFPGVYPNVFSPGSGIFVYEQCKKLANMGYQIIVLDSTYLRYNKWLDKTCRRVSVEKEKVGIRYTKHTRCLMISRLPKFAINSYQKNAKELYNIAVAKHGNPDLIISHFSFPAGFVASKIAEKEGIPCVVIEHFSLFLHKKINYYIIKILKSTLESATAFVCVSEHLKDAILKLTHLPKEIMVVPNMIDERFCYVPPREKNEFKFFSAGNLIEVKQFELLITSFCKAFSADEKVTLEIAGRGKLYDVLSKLIVSNKREHQIKLIGWTPRNEMLEKYVECDCFILLSKRETFGIVYREAMTVGRPIIATKNGGIEENWDDSQGILLENTDVLSIVEAMKKMVRNYTKYSSEYISKRCINMYSSDVVMNKYSELIERVINGGCKVEKNSNHYFTRSL